MISLRKGYLTAVVLVLGCLVLQAQYQVPSYQPTPSFLANIGEVLPNAPNTAAIQRFGGVEAEINSGVIKKNVELKPFAFRGIVVPISLGFNSMGLKVTDYPSRVGMGWHFLAGGSISRVVNGKDDFASSRYLPPYQFYPDSDDADISTYCFQLTSEGNRDASPDFFSFNIGAYSGTFVVEFDQNQAVIIKPVLATNVKIIYNEDGQTTSIWNFKAITPDGMTYYFGGTNAKEQTKTTGTQKFLEYVTNAWYINKIEDLAGNTVSFSYSEQTYGPITTAIEQTQIGNEPYCQGQSCNAPSCLASNTSQHMMYFKTPLLSLITDDNGGKLEIVYSTFGYPEKTINEIKYFSDASTLESKYSLEYSMVTPSFGSEIPFLNKIKEKSGSGTDLSAGHSFSYYDLSNMPRRFTYSQDHWGFFNDKANLTNLIPPPLDQDLIVQSKFPNAVADRSPDPSVAKTGMLKEISYPTGGKDSIEYEGNSFTETKDMNGYTTNSEAVIGLYNSTYNYSTGQTFSIGYDPLIQLNISAQYTQPNSPAPSPGGKVFIKNASTGAIVNEFFLTPPIDGSTNINTLSEFIYLSPGTYLFQTASQGQYILTSCILKRRNGVAANLQTVQTTVGGLRVKRVTTTDNSGGPSMIKRYYYGTLNELNVSSALHYKKPTYFAYFNLVNIYYDPPPVGNTGSTGCVPNCQSEYINKVLHSSSRERLNLSEGRLVGYQTVIESIGGDNFENGAIEHKFHTVSDQSPYLIRSGVDKVVIPYDNTSIWSLGETEKTVYKKNGSSLQKVMRTEYENVVDLRKVSYVNGYVVNQINKIGQMCWSSNPVLLIGPDHVHKAYSVHRYSIDCGWKYLKSKTETVWDANEQNPVVTNTEYIYDDLQTFNLSKRKLTNSKGELITEEFKYPIDFPYTAPYTSMIQKNIVIPVVEQTNKLTQSGNTKELSKVVTHFQELFGTTNNPLYKPSFIEQSISGNTLETEYVIDNYDNKGNILQTTDRKGITTSYYWGYSQRYPVVKVIGKTYAELVAAISQYSISTAVISNLSSTDLAMRTELNKFRSMSNCFVSTYTFKYPAGMTSETDPNGFTKYYEFDQFDRLVLIRDQNNTIIKKLCYLYNGMVENCTSPTIYGNQVQTQVFTKNDCTGCSTGSQVTYTVPAYTYTSTVNLAAANQLALDDIAANGQAYANTNGTCTSSSNVAITYNNSIGTTGFTALYTNTLTGQTYSFPIPTGSGTLGCIPAATYTLTISKPGNILLIFFGCGCKTSTGTSSSFGKVNVSASTCNTVTMDWAY